MVQFYTERCKRGVIDMEINIFNILPNELKGIKKINFLMLIRRNLKVICCAMSSVFFENF
jgi:hypothetical protein